MDGWLEKSKIKFYVNSAILEGPGVMGMAWGNQSKGGMPPHPHPLELRVGPCKDLSIF